MIFLEIQRTALRGESILLLNLIYSVIRYDYHISLLCSRANQSNSLSICMHLLSSSSAQFSYSGMSNYLWPHGLQHTRLPCPSPAPGACSNSCPSRGWCHPAISFSVIPFSSCLNLSQHQGLFRCVSSSHQVARVLDFQLQHQSFQWLFRTYSWFNTMHQAII